MTDEARLARLTELARRVWPHAWIEQYGDEVFVDDETGGKLRLDHPRALDALEAALLVLAKGKP